MIRNLSLMIVVDLEHPETLRESFFNWISFINTSLMNFISDLEPDLRNALQERFEKVYAKNRLVYSTTQDGEPAEVVNVESAMDIDFSLGVPILIVANKSDALDLLEQKAIDSIQYTLRSLAIKYGATVMYASSKSNSNVDTLVDYLSYTLLDDERVKLSVDVSNEKLFIPVGFDHVDDLAAEFQDAQNYTFQRKGRQQPTRAIVTDDGTQEIIEVDEFLRGLKEGKILYGPLPKIQKPIENPSEPPIRPSIFGKPTQRIMDILERKKP
jgi:hypothetical protein